MSNTQQLFSIDDIRTYINSKDSFGDVAYYLSAENIQKAVREKQEREQETQEDENEY